MKKFRSAVRQGILILGLSLLSAVALADSPVLKSGFDLTTLSTTVGNTANNARYVVSTSFPAGSSNTVTLIDAVPNDTSYISGSLQAPPGAMRSWSTDGGLNYVSAEPGSASSVTHVKIQNSSATSDKTGFAAVPVPPAGAISGGRTGGDGYRVIPFENKVYTIYHHNAC